MKRSYKRLAIILSIVMLICLFAPYGVAAETTGDSSGDLTVTSGGTNEDGDGLGEGEDEDLGEGEGTGGEEDKDAGEGEDGDPIEGEGTGGKEGGDLGEGEGTDEGKSGGATMMSDSITPMGIGDIFKTTLNLYVSPAGAGTLSPSAGTTHYYYITDTATIKAFPNTAENYVFSHWSGDTWLIDKDSSTIYASMATSRKLTANFKKVYTINAVSSDTSMGTVSPASKTFDADTTVTISNNFMAQPKSGYEFVRWEMDRNPVTSVKADATKTITAVFKPKTYTLTASVNNPDRGTVTPNTGSYDGGSEVTVTATANPGYKLVGWSYTQESAEGVNIYAPNNDTIKVLMKGNNLNKYVTAIFEPATYSLNTSVSLAPNGSAMGTVTPSAGTFNNGNTVTLTAAPSSSGYEFVKWEYTQEKYDSTKNVYSTSGNKITVTMRGENLTKYVKAVFKQVKYSADAYVGTKDANGNTVLAPHMGKVDKPRSEWYMWYDDILKWEKVEITATANEGYQFVGWEYKDEIFYYPWPITYNVYNEIGTKIKVYMKGDTLAKQVTAIFKPISYNVNATVSPEGSGSITGNGPYDCGSEVTLTATPNDPSAYAFKQWTGNLPDGVSSTDSTITFTMPAGNVSLVAEFEAVINPPTQYTLETVAVNGTITDGSTYDEGTEVIIEISPNAGYEFDRWEDSTGYTVPDPTGEDGKFKVEMTGNILVKVYFKEIYTPPTSGSISVNKNVVGEQLFYAVSVDVGGTSYEDIVDDTEFIVSLYDSNDVLIDSKTISENEGAEFTDLDLGTYYLYETVTSGYTRVDDLSNWTEIILDEENNNAEWMVVNQLNEDEPIPSIGIEKTVNKSNAYAGDSVRYTITVTNTGDTTLGSIVVYDDLIDKSWGLAPLDPLSSVVITFDYTIPANARVNDIITNNATVYANEYMAQKSLLSEGDSESDILWEEDGNIAESEYGLDFGLTETASANVTVIARQRDRERSSVTTYTLRTAVEGEGTVSPGPGTSQYSSGSTVQLSAVPAEGWKFDGWQGDTVDDNNQIIMNGNKSVTAVFSKIEEELEDEPTPQAPATEPQDSVIEEEEIPAAPVDELPKTGGVPAGVFYGIGGLLAAAGAVLKKKIKK